MSDYKNYRKKNVQPMRPYMRDVDWRLVDNGTISVSGEDRTEAQNGGEGGMVAINPANPTDQWYVAKAFFEANYELAE